MEPKRIGVGAVFALAALGLVLSSMGVLATPPQATGQVYADGQLFSTFVTTPLPPGPATSFDQLYHFPGTDLIALSNAGPTNPAYKGGRWMVFNVAFTGMAPTQFTDNAQLVTAASQGLVTISGPVQYVQCPLLPM